MRRDVGIRDSVICSTAFVYFELLMLEYCSCVFVVVEAAM